MKLDCLSLIQALNLSWRINMIGEAFDWPSVAGDLMKPAVT